MKKLLILIMPVVLVACSDAVSHEHEPQPELAAGRETEGSSSCPYLTKDHKGNIVLSWVQHVNDSSALMCYAVSTDKGKSFRDTVIIPVSNNIRPHAENMPKIIFKPNGEIIAMWGADSPDPVNKYAGLVFYSQSFDGGKTWTAAHPLVSDPASTDQRYFDLALLPDGEACVIWLDSRRKTEKEGSTLYFATTSGTNGFVNEKAIGETCCPCCRTDLFVDSRSGIHVAYRKIINDSIRDMVHAVSSDGGTTFTPAARISADNWAIAGCPHTGPTLVENKNGLHFSWYTMGGGSGVFYCTSSDNGETFSPRDSVSGKATAKHPQMVTLPSGEIIIAWDESVQNGEEVHSRIDLQRRSVDGQVIDRRYMVAAGTGSEFPVLTVIDEQTVLVAYTQKTEQGTQVKYEAMGMTGVPG